MIPVLDIRPQLERLDRLICWSKDIDEGALTFAFRPLWQLGEPARAALALAMAQATQVYAGLKLWPDAVMAKLAEAQLVADGTYPNAAAVFAEQVGEVVMDAREVGAVPQTSGGFWPEGKEPRDWHGRWTTGGDSGASGLIRSEAFAAPPAKGQRLAGPLPVGSLPADTPLGGLGQEPHAPDGTPVDLASSRERARVLARMMGALAAAARFVWRWLPERPDGPIVAPPPVPINPPQAPDSAPTAPATSSSPRLNQGQQDKHIPGKNNYEPGKSILDHPNPQQLLDDHAGTTKSVNQVPLGQPGSKERIDFGQPIGRSRNQTDGSYYMTTRGMIHYGKRVAHIVPIEPK